ncbi:hypothetical protein FDP22_14860 [Paroceanicella profunda]|uniref:Uncharacterized protein n=1 Tax=Paroceanicella profunda TaxID=2579971 RepID=A0A5B8FZV5_9RHOB|nr:hypothetical protein [Paroceanicella profunda]QDL92950.1 hypothetical protein FDP22_14860 [Paroceanicella profunda]
MHKTAVVFEGVSEILKGVSFASNVAFFLLLIGSAFFGWSVWYFVGAYILGFVTKWAARVLMENRDMTVFDRGMTLPGNAER